MKPLRTKIIIIGLSLIIGLCAHSISAPNGIVEQAAEAVLRTVGIDIDFSYNIN